MISWFWIPTPILILVLSSSPSSNAFSMLTSTISTQQFSSNVLKFGTADLVSPQRTISSFNSRGRNLNPGCRSFHDTTNTNDNDGSTSTTTRLMYNLPPSGGGGGKNDIADIAKGAFSIFLIIAFFVSPLGGLILGIFNSFLILLIGLPLIATVSFQVWQKINTVSGSCPNCGTQATVMKQKRAKNAADTTIPQQSLCISCGALLQANDDNTEINNVSGRTSIEDLNSERDGVSLFDILSNGTGSRTATTSQSTTTRTTTETSTRTKTSSKPKEMDIIDVDVEDDKPFQ